MDQKAIIRTEALRNLARMEREPEAAEQATNLFFEHIKPQKGQIIGLYWPLPSEFDLHPLMDRITGDKLDYALPSIQKNTLELGFISISETTELKKNHLNVYEPVMNPGEAFVDPDIIIVPLLAFDRRGYRMGRGGGYYDATLAALRRKKQITAIGMAYAQQACLFNLPIEDHDQKLDWIITPDKAQYYGS